jgi:hypothetical protein
VQNRQNTRSAALHIDSENRRRFQRRANPVFTRSLDGGFRTPSFMKLYKTPRRFETYIYRRKRHIRERIPAAAASGEPALETRRFVNALRGSGRSGFQNAFAARG